MVAIASAVKNNFLDPLGTGNFPQLLAQPLGRFDVAPLGALLAKLQVARGTAQQDLAALIIHDLRLKMQMTAMDHEPRALRRARDFFKISNKIIAILV